MPENPDAPAQATLRALAESAAYRDDFGEEPVRDWHVLGRDAYYDLLSPRAARLDIWRTEYCHVMSGTEAIVDFYRGSALRPYLQRLPATRHEAFLADFTAAMAAAYPARADGRVLFPFMRLFLIAYR